ncbi:hypothetical protein GCM10007170_46490 [Arthrobacter liuii]|uniref:Uncharacterized protein n=1 Tax=Arthrobacter liuii TaxID=1476996 RepID=A0ABQ2AZP7_9MICC|nr:hypothetical protein GCM10007170_46490 [Arthrobacter liuii]
MAVLRDLSPGGLGRGIGGVSALPTAGIVFPRSLSLALDSTSVGVSADPTASAIPHGISAGLRANARLATEKLHSRNAQATSEAQSLDRERVGKDPS